MNLRQAVKEAVWLEFSHDDVMMIFELYHFHVQTTFDYFWETGRATLIWLCWYMIYVDSDRNLHMLGMARSSRSARAPIPKTYSITRYYKLTTTFEWFCCHCLRQNDSVITVYMSLPTRNSTSFNSIQEIDLYMYAPCIFSIVSRGSAEYLVYRWNWSEPNPHHAICRLWFLRVTLRSR